MNVNTPGKHYWATWKCLAGKGHPPYKAWVYNRAINGSGCPRCAGREADGENNLAVAEAELAKQWHPTKNKDVTPTDVTPKSNEKVYWQCPDNPKHVWRAQVASRTKGAGCPKCCGLIPDDLTSLSAQRPDLAAELHPGRNRGRTADSVKPGTHDATIWWLCKNGHEWQESPKARSVLKDPTCKRCRSIAMVLPKLAEEFHPDATRGPWELTPGSSAKVLWRCRNDPSHVWRTTVQNRAQRGDGCPECSLLPRSKQEIRLAAELALYFNVDFEKHTLRVKGKRHHVDIMLPGHRLIIEFDGSYHHEHLEDRDREKTAALQSAGWRVIRAREHPLKPLSDCDVVVPFLDTKGCADAVLKKIEQVLGISIPGLDRYLNRETPANQVVADEYIEAFLAARARSRREKAARRKRRAGGRGRLK